MKAKSLKMKTITHTVFIPAKPVEVYDTIMNPRKHSDFTGAKATCTRRLGGNFTAWDGYIFGTILELEPRKKIVQEWQTTEWPQGYPPSRLELTFTMKDNGTEITMIHSKVPEVQVKKYNRGWIDHYWEPLKKYFEYKIRFADVKRIS
jgi:activator of HSP90 ATPase